MEAKSDVVRAVRSMVDAVNSGDVASALAAFSDTPIIVEDIAPYMWRGAGAASAWLSAMAANTERLNVESVLMTLEQPARVEMDEDAAYTLFPGQLSLAAAGIDLVAQGMLTLTLRRTGDRWLIDSLVWSGPEPAPR
jgi:ketosteroid isomerase-like protein